MGYAFIIFGVLIASALVIANVVMYGVAKDSQKAPLKALNDYAAVKIDQAQTDFVVNNTKINGTAIYTSVTGSPNVLNLYLTIKNNGSIVLNPSQYSILFNRSWVWINSTSNNATAPLLNSSTSSLNLAATPPLHPMPSLSLIVAAKNGVKIITPTSPIITSLSAHVNTSNTCWYDANMTWLPSYGEMWPIVNYTVYYTDDSTQQYTKNIYNVSFTTGSSTSTFIGNAYSSTRGSCNNTGNSSVYMWMTARDAHGNEGPPSNTCTAQGSGGGTVNCNYP